MTKSSSATVLGVVSIWQVDKPVEKSSAKKKLPAVVEERVLTGDIDLVAVGPIHLVAHGVAAVCVVDCVVAVFAQHFH